MSTKLGKIFIAVLISLIIVTSYTSRIFSAETYYYSNQDSSTAIAIGSEFWADVEESNDSTVQKIALINVNEDVAREFARSLDAKIIYYNDAENVAYWVVEMETSTDPGVLPGDGKFSWEDSVGVVEDGSESGYISYNTLGMDISGLLGFLGIGDGISPQNGPLESPLIVGWKNPLAPDSFNGGVNPLYLTTGGVSDCSTGPVSIPYPTTKSTGVKSTKVVIDEKEPVYKISEYGMSMSKGDEAGTTSTSDESATAETLKNFFGSGYGIEGNDGDESDGRLPIRFQLLVKLSAAANTVNEDEVGGRPIDPIIAVEQSNAFDINADLVFAVAVMDTEQRHDMGGIYPGLPLGVIKDPIIKEGGIRYFFGFVDPADISRNESYDNLSVCIDCHINNKPEASIASLWSVNGAQIGQSSTLWAKVENTGYPVLPSDARVFFYVSGPGYSGWAGSASVANLATGETRWYSFNWSIPADAQAGTYNYRAMVWSPSSDPKNISPWSNPQTFTVTNNSSAQVNSLWSVYGAQCGQSSRLWANVKNTGYSVLPSDARVWFYVSGPGFKGWVGSASAANLSAGGGRWYGLNWTIPGNTQAGSYNYRAMVWSPSSNPKNISPWSSAQTFTLNCQ